MSDPQVPSNSNDLVLEEFKPGKLVLTDAGITQYVYEDCACIAKPIVDGEYHTADWLISFDGLLIGVQLYHAALDAEHAERARLAKEGVIT